MSKQWKTPFWTNSTKDKLTCRLNITHEDGSFTTSVATVSKYDAQGNISKDYQEILEQNTLEEIDKFTQDRIDRHKTDRESHIARKKEEEKHRSLEQIFNKKLKAFEVDAIKNSPNRKLKAKLRRSTNEFELYAYAVMLIMEANNEESFEEEKSK